MTGQQIKAQVSEYRATLTEWRNTLRQQVGDGFAYNRGFVAHEEFCRTIGADPATEKTLPLVEWFVAFGDLEKYVDEYRKELEQEK